MPAVETVQPGRLSEGQQEILNFVKTRGQTSIDEFRDQIDDLRALISQGYLSFTVEVYEWGVSFEVFPNMEYALHPPQ